MNSSRQVTGRICMKSILKMLFYLIGILFMVKAMTTLQSTSLWNDELSTVEKSFQSSVPFLFKYLSRDTHPPFYYLLMMGSGQIFGKTLLTLRGFSWIAYVGACFASSVVIKSTFSKEPYPALAFLLTASSPFAVRYASEGKAYALLLLLINLLLIVRARIVFNNRSCKNNFLFYVLTLTALSLTHFYGYALVLSISFCDLIFKRKEFFKFNLLSLVLPTLWTLLNIGFLVSQGGRGTLDQASISTITSILKLSLGTNWPLLVFVFGVAVLWMLLQVGTKKIKLISKALSLDAVALVVLFTLLISLIKPSSSARYYIIAIPSLICGFSVLAASFFSDRLVNIKLKYLLFLFLPITIFDLWCNAVSPRRNPQILLSRSKTEHRLATVLGSQFINKISRQYNSLNLSDFVYSNSNLIPGKSRRAWIKLSDKKVHDSLSAYYQNLPENSTFIYALSRSTYVRKFYEKDYSRLVSLGAKCHRILPSVDNLRALNCLKPLSD